jgi:hypothetical protein
MIDPVNETRTQMSDAASRVREDIENLVEGFDIPTMTRRVEEFGRENPIGLALTAMGLGVAVGMLMRGSKRRAS